ncbi:MAG TPA: MFS transporter [Chloroflexota bacterium]|nr:MFS transporter [Chloroflexota bacterium]
MNRLWRNGDFLRLWYGQVVSSMGSGMSRLALPLLVLALTGSPVQAGLIGAAQTVPFLVLGLPAGALLDRWNRKTVMIVCDVARCLAFGSVPLAWALGGLTTAHLYLVALVHGTALVFFTIAQLAALPRVVPTPQLAEAHALNTASEGIATLVSPGVGGLLIGLAPTTAAGAALAYLVDSVSYAVSAASLHGIKSPFQTQLGTTPDKGLQRQIVEGLRFLWVRVDLRWLIVVNTLHRTCFAPVQLAVVVLAGQTFQADPRTIGLLFSAAGAGGLTAAAFTPRLRRRVSVGHSMLGLTALHALGLAVVATAPTPLVAAAGMFIAGAMENMTGIVQVTYRLAVIPDALQGRVNSSYRLVSFTGVTIGTALGGLLLAATDPRVVLALLAGGIALIAAGVAVSPIRRL